MAFVQRILHPRSCDKRHKHSVVRTRRIGTRTRRLDLAGTHRKDAAGWWRIFHSTRPPDSDVLFDWLLAVLRGGESYVHPLEVVYLEGHRYAWQRIALIVTDTMLCAAVHAVAVYLLRKRDLVCVLYEDA